MASADDPNRWGRRAGSRSSPPVRECTAEWRVADEQGQMDTDKRRFNVFYPERERKREREARR